MRLIFFLAMRQLWARKLLNGIAVGGVAMGVLVLLVVNGVMQGFQMKFKDEILKVSPHVTLFDRELRRGQTLLEAYAGGLVARHVLHEHPSDRVTRIKRAHDLMRALSMLPNVQAVCLGLNGQAILSLGDTDYGIDLRGVQPQAHQRCSAIASYVQQGAWRELISSPNGVALGSGVARILKAHVGDQLRIVAPGGSPQTLKVVAIFESGALPIDDFHIYTNLTLAQTVLRRPNTISRVELRLLDPFAAQQLAARLEKITGYDTESWQEANANFLALFDTQNVISSMVVAAVLAVGGFGILAIQIMIVLQKTRDIAILRSVGLRRMDILLVFLLQGIVVSLIGALVGDLMGWRLLEIMSKLEIPTEALVKSSTLLIYKDPMYYLYGVVFALIAGISASLLPAWRGSRVEPVDVLRGQI